MIDDAGPEVPKTAVGRTLRPRRAVLGLIALLALSCDILNPRLVTRLDVQASVMDVFVHDSLLLVAARDSGLLGYSISNPKVPVELWRAAFGRDCRCVFAQDGKAYVGTDSGVAVHDILTGDRTWRYAGGVSQVVTALTTDSTRLYAATMDGISLLKLATLDLEQFIPMAGEPTGLARRDTRLFVSLRDWGLRLIDLLPGDSFVLDTLQLGKRNRAEGVTVSSSGYCLVSQGDSGLCVYYTPTPNTLISVGGGGGGGSFPTYAAAATDGAESLSIYAADSLAVTLHRLIRRPDFRSYSVEGGLGELSGFTRRIHRGRNGYLYTASGNAGIYVIRE